MSIRHADYRLGFAAGKHDRKKYGNASDALASANASRVHVDNKVAYAFGYVRGGDIRGKSALFEINKARHWQKKHGTRCKVKAFDTAGRFSERDIENEKQTQAKTDLP